MSIATEASAPQSVPLAAIERKEVINRYLGPNSSLACETMIVTSEESPLATTAGNGVLSAEENYNDQSSYTQFRSWDGRTYFEANDVSKIQQYKRLQELDNGVHRKGIADSSLDPSEKRQIEYKARTVEMVCGHLGMERQKTIQYNAKRRLFNIKDLRSDVRGFSCTFNTALTIIAIEHKCSRDTWDKDCKIPITRDALKREPIAKRRGKPIAETEVFKQLLDDRGLTKYAIEKAGRSIYGDEYESPYIS